MAKKIKNDDYDYLFRIIILGDSMVGKTSVTRRYIKNSFTKEHELVIGFSMEEKYIERDNKLIKLLITDKFNPSERFEEKMQLLYMIRNILFLVIHMII